MHSSFFSSQRFTNHAAAAFILCVSAALPARAVDGVWTESTGLGVWSNPANWQSGNIADGTGSTANFNQVDVNAVTANATDRQRYLSECC